MRAWHVAAPGPVTGHPLRLHPDDETPRPGPGELLLKVLACGVCRTDLHVTEGDLPPHRPGVTPGHEVVGEVAALGDGATGGFAVGDRVGAAWLRSTDNTCRFCLRDAENLCPASRYTGWDADGGYAEYMTVPAAYAYHLPDRLLRTRSWPRCCAPASSATAPCSAPSCRKVAASASTASAAAPTWPPRSRWPAAPPCTCSPAASRPGSSRGNWARRSVGDAADLPPEPLDAADPVRPGRRPGAARPASPGPGRHAVHRGHPPVPTSRRSTTREHLFQERQLRSVTANTRADAREFLGFAAGHKLAVTVHRYPLDAADQALRDLKAGAFDGAAVLVP